MALANQGNFIFIIKRYKEKLFNYIRRITNMDDEDAEDILQEVFIKVYLNLNDFDTSLKFSSWIYRIAHNQVISQHRKLKARPEGTALKLDDGAVKTIAADLDIKKDVDLKILRENIFGTMEKLDSKYKEILILKFFEEKSYQEISDIIKKPMGTVASLLNRAKEKFGNEFSKQNIKM
ncbi:hypothetical protein DRH27_04610 [Candidatus Falkowbacteria bacterium]|nr:MAG: hypothetical protein DRH27_04610 [Candidatus Falkowbacteria bacterium]